MNTVSFTVRDLPAHTHALLAKIAKANKRSLAKEVVIAIESYITGPSDDLRGTSDQRCKRCGAFEWTRIHQASCVTSKEPKSQTAGYFEVIHPKRKPAPKRAKGKRNA